MSRETPAGRSDHAGAPHTWLDQLFHLAYQAVWTGGLVVSAPYLALRARRDSREMRERRGRWGPLPPGSQHGVWVHAASMGEVRAALALVEGLRALRTRAFLSVMTPTARLLDADALRSGADFVRFVPLDFGPWIGRAMAIAKPSALLICETEIWPGLLRAASRAAVPTAFVSARLSAAGVMRLRLMRPWLMELLREPYVCAQSEIDARRWLDLGVVAEHLAVTGNLKYHKPVGPLGSASRRTQRGDWDAIVVLGSVRSGELAEVSGAIKALSAKPDSLAGGRTLIIVAPRHPDRAEPLWQRLRSLGMPVQERRAKADELVPQPEAPGGPELLFVRTVGELRRFYALADVGFVGGTLCPIGGHSLYEVAELGVPVIHGPSTAQVADVAATLRAAGGGLEVADGAALAAAIGSILSDAGLRARMSRGALQATTELGGATARTLQALARWGFPLGEATDELD